KKAKKIIQKVLPVLKNKYVFTTLAFIIWLSFFDKNDFISEYTYRQQLKSLRQDKQFYLNEIKENKEKMNELMSSPANLEKFAREKYYMKKDDEDVFVIVYNDPVKEEKYIE
ncbi:MAG TPA: septum formation initiator family protein, partial [Bacteroidia bacterium]|nr:septum formation initiator family protein [Bacteroidia bacterium]